MNIKDEADRQGKLKFAREIVAIHEDYLKECPEYVNDLCYQSAKNFLEWVETAPCVKEGEDHCALTPEAAEVIREYLEGLDHD